MHKPFFLPAVSLFCIVLFSTTLYSREGNPARLDQPELETGNSVIRMYHIPGVGPISVGGVEEITPEQIAKIPRLRIKRKSPLLPEEHTNNEEKYFPKPVVNQGAFGSCAQAASIGHHFTYIIGLARDETTRYPHNYTWNFLNVGDANGGSNFLDGWEIVNENGIPNQTAWGSLIDEFTKWMTGYDLYFEAMKNRYVDIHKVDISTLEGIENLRQWIYDFGDGSETGGLACFSVNCVQPLFDVTLQKFDDGTPKAGWPCVAGWGAKGGHVMTIVGWHDSVSYDVNKDGKITTDEDITGDGTVDVKDREKGAWLVANTWGPGWPATPNMRTQGYYYMLYRTGALERGDAYADTADQGNGTIVDFNAGGLSTNKHVFTISTRLVEDKVNRQMAYKIKMSHDTRDQISIVSGVSNKTDDATPEYSRRFIIFNYQAGAHPMQGQGASGEIELGLDVKHLLNHVDNKKAKFFLSIDSKGGTGTVESFSLMDYRGTDPVETKCDETNVSIDVGTTTLAITYESAMDPLTISTDTLPHAVKGTAYTHQLAATGGSNPYAWELMKNVYYEVDNGSDYPSITDEVSPNDTDDGLAEQELGFDFPFYGDTVKKIYIATDGHIMFEDAFTYIRSKKALMANKVIAVLGSDLVYQSGDKIYFKKEIDKATIRWQTKHMWSAEGILDVNLDFAAVLHKSGKIEYFYKKGMSGDVTGMAVGASGGAGAHVTYDYGALSDIPDGHKFGLFPEEELSGMTVSADGKLSGTPGNDKGEYRMTVSALDALEINKVKSFTFKIGDITGIKTTTAKVLSPLTISQRNGSAITFSFGMSKRAAASLDVFSLDGKKVHTVFNGPLKAGKHSLVWNNDGKHSRILARGVYLCKLSVGNERAVRKIAVMK